MITEVVGEFESKMSCRFRCELNSLLKFFQDWINANIVDNLDPDYCFEFTGINQESEQARIERQEKEVRSIKTVNEIRGEQMLPPIKNCDILLDPTFLTWYGQYSDAGKRAQQDMMEQQQGQMQQQQMGEAGADDSEEPVSSEEPSHEQQWRADEASAENNHTREKEKMELAGALDKKKIQKSNMPIKIEYYKIK